MTRLERFNVLEDSLAVAELLACCSSTRWVERLLARRPFATDEDLLAAADEVWRSLHADDWMETFASHPRIGASSREVESHAAPEWSRREQAGVEDAGADVRAALAAGNDDYFERFGFVFLVCAQGRSAEAMLAELEARLANDRETEIRNAAEEQRKITRLRLRRYLDELS